MGLRTGEDIEKTVGMKYFDVKLAARKGNSRTAGRHI
jgi:hypothetical protein